MIICVTGQMASGKNYICSKMEERGFLSLDLDKVAHEAISISTQEILKAFKGEADSRGISLLKVPYSLRRPNLR